MPKISVSGESITEVAELSELLSDLAKVHDEELLPIFMDLITMRDALRELTNERRSARKSVVKRRAGISGGDSPRYALELLKAMEYHDVASLSGQGGSWRYEADS